jgi:hypothetical protein
VDRWAGRHLEAAARPLATVAVLLDRHARQLGDQSLGHATHLGTARYHGDQWAAIAANNEGAVAIFEFREAAQFVEHVSGRL